MLTSGGRPICTAPPASVSPLRKCRRETRNRLTMTCDTGSSSFPGKFSGAHHRDYHFLKPKSRAPEALEDLAKEGTVAGCLGTSGHVPEILLDDTLLALRAGRQHRSQFLRRREGRIGKARHLSSEERS